MTFVTDYGVHGSWIRSEVDHYYIPSSQAIPTFHSLGVPIERIHAHGLPIRPSFWNKQQKEEARVSLGLSNYPTILFMGGGLGIGFSSSLLDSVSPFLKNLQCLIVTGKNEQLYKKLVQLPITTHRHVHVYPFTDSIHELMDASDLLISKPGGMTCTEALAKKLPILMLEPIPGQEEDNASFILGNNIGLLSKNEHFLASFLEDFAKHPQETLTNFTFDHLDYHPENIIQSLLDHIQAYFHSNNSTLKIRKEIIKIVLTSKATSPCSVTRARS